MTPCVALGNLVDQILLLPTKVVRLHTRLLILIETLGKPQLFPEICELESRVISSLESFLDLKENHTASVTSE